MKRIFISSCLIVLSVGFISAEELTVRFLSPAAGAKVRAEVPAAGLAVCSAEVEARGPICWKLALEADGIKMSEAQAEDKEFQVKRTLAWWPWHGNGTYHLRVHAMNFLTQSFTAQAEVSVEVTGVPSRAATPLERLRRILREKSGQAGLETLPVTRLVSGDPAQSRWVSAAWLGKEVYQAYLYDDGREETVVHPINYDPKVYTVFHYPVVRPSGAYSLLIVLLDHGTMKLDGAETLAAARKAAADANRDWRDFSLKQGLKDSVFKLDISVAYARTEPDPSNLLLPLDRVKTLTGLDPAQFDLYAQVDLSQSLPPAADGKAGGINYHNYNGGPPQSANIWALARDPATIYSTVRWIVLDHELAHSFGWQHEWPVGLGGAVENTDYKSVMPVLLLGWTDIDGDGVVEILDPAPYGRR